MSKWKHQLVVVGENNGKEIVIYGFCTIDQAKERFKKEHPGSKLIAIHTD